jgi:glutamine amidotransferase
MTINSTILIIDYGSGNLRSVANALEQVKNSKQNILISGNPRDLTSASHIILPGVGAFGDCISNLKSIPGMVAEIKNQINSKKPFLGICLGMQLLADIGYEYGEHQGLSLIAGKVLKIEAKDANLKIPHMGWNNLEFKKSHPILKGIENGEHAYFVHSYHFICDDKNDVIATVNYDGNLTAVIAKDNILATQFHPEKSGELGLKLLKNFISF